MFAVSSSRRHRRAMVIAVIGVVLNSAMLYGQAKKPPHWSTGIDWPASKKVDAGLPGGPPSDAIVLFDGKDMSRWEGAESWRIQDGYAIAAETISTRQSFGDCQLHVEWAIPPEVAGKVEGNGNSGIFLMSIYEVQILDSHGSTERPEGQSGAIYKQRPPLVNACRKPGEWQVFDIIFKAPRFDDSGKLLRPAYITVLLNGVLVQNNFEIIGLTNYIRMPVYASHPAKMPLKLQYHNSPVRFRNIWIRELPEDDSEAQLAPFRAKMAAVPPGLYIRDGVMMRAGLPYRGIGANCFDLFIRAIHDPANKTYEDTLRQLSQAGIPFVRFSCGAFWPNEWELYLKNKDEYFARLDGVVRAAEKYRVGLIPSMFWYTGTVPDIVGEPRDQFGNPDSKTVAFVRRYAEEVVTRYKHSTALWAWEFGNEFNLIADLPNASSHRPHVIAKFKTATTRSARDDLRSEHMLTAYVEFAKTVRKHDQDRMMLSGNAIIRPNAWHNTHENNWKFDTPEQSAEILLRDNPDPLDAISVHIYPAKDGKYAFAAPDIAGLIRSLQKTALQARKPLFIGECGAPNSMGASQARGAFEEIIKAIEDNGVPLAAFWVVDYGPQDKDWNVTFTNDRAYMIDLVAKANIRLMGK